MKHFITTILLLFLFSASGISQEGTPINRKDAQGNKTGLWKDYYKTGKLRYVGHFKNDIPIDTFYYYYPDGKLQTLMVHLKKDYAYAKMYYSTGDIMAEGKYHKQQKDSVWNTYGAEGILVTKGGYVNGAKTGNWETYFPNGKVAERVQYRNDIEVDDYRSFYENGNLKEETQFENGFKEGLTTFYDENGNKQLKGFYKKSMRNGKWIYYNTNGTVDKMVDYKDGKALNNPSKDLEIPEVVKSQRKETLELEDLKGRIKYD
jgi:antitoxin component YwqK of YwqJK toxin-antitoxin module